MHENVKAFLAYVKSVYPGHFRSVRVLELGSLDVNGSPRQFFEDCKYEGADWRDGPGVDIVNFAEDLEYADESFDTIVCTEMFEHDVNAEFSLLNALRMLKTSGLFVFTCANEKRAPHNLEAGFEGYYRGVSKSLFISWLLRLGGFSEIYLRELGEDLQGWIAK